MTKVKVMDRKLGLDRVNRMALVFHIVRKAKNPVDVYYVLGKMFSTYGVQATHAEVYGALRLLSGRDRSFTGVFRNELKYNPVTKLYSFNINGTIRVKCVNKVGFTKTNIDIPNRIVTVEAPV